MNATAILMATWGDEWSALDPEQRAAVARDYADAALVDACDSATYLRNVGRGNLASYARTLLAKPKRANGGYALVGAMEALAVLAAIIALGWGASAALACVVVAARFLLGRCS